MLLNTIKKLECQLIKTIYINYGFSPESIILIKSYPEFVYKVNYKNSKFILKILKKDKIDIERINFIKFIQKSIEIPKILLNYNNKLYSELYFDEYKLFFYLQYFIEGTVINYENNNNAIKYGRELSLIHIKSMNYRKHYAEVDIFKECIEELECILEILKPINKKAYYSFNTILIFFKEKSLESIYYENLIFIHGDTHGGNAILAKKIYFIDWDDSKLYDKYYDISCFYWMCITLNKMNLWNLFCNGYQENYPINYTQNKNKILKMSILKDLKVFKYYLEYSQMIGSDLIKDIYITKRYNFVKNLIDQII